MQCYEYRLVTIGSPSVTWLNEQGQQGWQVAFANWSRKLEKWEVMFQRPCEKIKKQPDIEI